jgi:steroid 5-alpha reductase family enzyme
MDCPVLILKFLVSFRRWPILRNILPAAVWQVFALVFVAFYQNFLLLFLTAPVYVCWRFASVAPVFPSTGDLCAAAAFITLLVFETIADQQQWTFQNRKHAMIAAGTARGGDFARGFLTHGLFRYSRHPNFFCEFSIWWAVYAFAVTTTGHVLHWSGIGALLLTLLFTGSAQFTEWLSVQKYPQYKLYQKTTSRLVPWLPGRPLPNKSA